VNKRMTKQELRHDGFIEWITHATTWVQQNFMSVALGVVILAIGVVATVWFRQEQRQSRAEAGQLMHRASNSYLSGAYSEGLLTLDELLSRHGDTSDGRDGLYLAGASHLLLGENDKAIERFEEYLRARPRGLYAPSSKIGIALALEGRGDLAEAALNFRELRTGLASDDALRVQAGLGEARVMETLGQIGGAIEALESLLDTEDPTVQQQVKAEIAVLKSRQSRANS